MTMRTKSTNKMFSRVVVFVLLFIGCSGQRIFEMDKASSCDKTATVSEQGVSVRLKGNIASPNPPRRCVLYLQSAYTRDDGTNKFEIRVQALTIYDGSITLRIFDGRKSAGVPLRTFGQSSVPPKSTDLIYSTTNKLTIVVQRTQDYVYQTKNDVTLYIVPWKDGEARETDDNVMSLSVFGIIGIIIGCLVVIAVIIIVCWCCCTGRIGGGFMQRYQEKYFKRSAQAKQSVSENHLVEKSKPIEYKDPFVWNTAYSNNSQKTYYKRNEPRIGRLGRNFDNNRSNYNNRDDHYYKNDPYRETGRDYEPYDFETQQRERSERQRRPNRQVQPSEVSRQETLIDDVFDSDSANDSTLQKQPTGKSPKSSPKHSPKSHRKNKEEEDDEDNPEDEQGSPQIQRYLSMDLQSQPDTETISSPLHVNAGVRASVEDDLGSPYNSLKKSKYPKHKRREDKEPDKMAMPPEAFDPIFTAPIEGIDYHATRPQYGNPYAGLVPYGLIPAGFAAGPPGSQTYAYAYQTPSGYGGKPAVQGAMFVQNTPTTEGNKRTAIAVQQTLAPNKNRTPDSKRRRNSNPKNRYDPTDTTVIARGAAPPDPGPGHRSVAMKSGTDPDSGVKTTQVVWTDSVPDATDPKPGENPQITRKTVTRVTTKSGYNDLPPMEDPLLALEDEPAFLSPSNPRGGNSQIPGPPMFPLANSPEASNVNYYTNATSSVVSLPPQRAHTPTSIHKAQNYSSAIRDRIPLDKDESNV